MYIDIAFCCRHTSEYLEVITCFKDKTSSDERILALAVVFFSHFLVVIRNENLIDENLVVFLVNYCFLFNDSNEAKQMNQVVIMI